MPSQKDLNWLETKFHPVHANRPPMSTYQDYRDFIDTLEPLKNFDPMPEVGRYLEKVQLRPGVTTDIAVPKSGGPFPIFLNCHGNAQIWGSAHSYRRFTRDLALGGYLSVCPDYRLGPEHKFPAAFDDMMFTASWIRDNARQYNADPARMVVCGDSTGAGLAGGVVLALQAQVGTPKLRAAVFIEGFMDRTEHVNGPTAFLLRDYLGDNYAEMVKDSRVSPIFAIKPGVLPPTLLITGSADFAAPNMMAFASALLKNNIPFQMHVIEGMPHDFMKFPELEGCAEGHRLMFDFLRRNV